MNMYMYSLPLSLSLSLSLSLLHQKYEEAEECFKTAIDHDPDYTDAVEELRATQIKRLMVLIIIVL